jgi:hypothetical protein
MSSCSDAVAHSVDRIDEPGGRYSRSMTDRAIAGE